MLVSMFMTFVLFAQFWIFFSRIQSSFLQVEKEDSNFPFTALLQFQVPPPEVDFIPAMLKIQAMLGVFVAFEMITFPETNNKSP